VIRLKKALTGLKNKSGMKRTKAKKCPQLSGREGKNEMKRIKETVTQDTKAERQELYKQAVAHAARIRAFIARMDGKAEPEKKSEAEPVKAVPKAKHPAKKKAQSPDAPEVKAPAAQAGPALVLAPSPTSQTSLEL
jgi:hypothetical protein